MLACWLLAAARRPLFACSASGRGSAACWSGRAWPSRIGGGCGWQVLLAARNLRAARSAALPRWPLSLRKRWGREMLWHYTVPLVHARVYTPLLLGRGLCLSICADLASPMATFQVGAGPVRLDMPPHDASPCLPLFFVSSRMCLHFLGETLPLFSLTYGDPWVSNHGRLGCKGSGPCGLRH